MTAPTDQQVIDAVDRIAPRAIALLQALVRTPSLTGDEGAVQQLVAAAMTEIGLDVDVWDPSAEELAPYSEHVGAFDTLAGRPNVVGRCDIAVRHPYLLCCGCNPLRSPVPNSAPGSNT